MREGRILLECLFWTCFSFSGTLCVKLASVSVWVSVWVIWRITNRHTFKVCRIKNRHTFKSMPILNSAYFTAWYDDMTSAFGKVCRIKNRHTFKSMPILNSAYFTECRFVIRHITQTETQTETELLRRHGTLTSIHVTNIALMFYAYFTMTWHTQYIKIMTK